MPVKWLWYGMLLTCFAWRLGGVFAVMSVVKEHDAYLITVHSGSVQLMIT